MRQLPDSAEVAAIAESIETLELSAPAGARDLLARYAAEICRWTRRVDLTGARDPESFARGPLFDALTLAPLLAPTGKLVDVGSGGGLPGIPMAILFPELRVTLVEPRARRASFLRHAVHLLGIDCEVVQGRDEELRAGRWDHAVAQAVFLPSEWLRRAPRLLEPGGSVYVLSSAPVSPTDLPEGSTIRAARSFPRPADGKPRCVTRIAV